MGSGSVLHMTGETRFTKLGSLYLRMPWTFLFTLIGVFSLSAFPFFSGFVTKSMIIDADFETHRLWAGFGLMIASAGTFLAGLKMVYFIWFGNNNCSQQVWERAADPVWNMNAAMAINAVLCIFVGSYTPYLYHMLPFHIAEYHPYTSFHISETMSVLLFSAFGFFLFKKKFVPEAKIILDMDWFYRLGGQVFLRFSQKRVQVVDNLVGEVYRAGGLIPLKLSALYVNLFDNRVVDGIVDGTASGVLNVGNRLRVVQRGALQENLMMSVSVMVFLVLTFLWFF
jgi:multicomponent Na+:H+ antiporter subunit D